MISANIYNYQFLKKSSIHIIWLLIFILSCSRNNFIELKGETMGTTYSIKMNDRMGKIKRKSIIKNKIDSLLHKINIHFSTYIPTSEINSFNHFSSLKPFNASAELRELISKSLELYKLSDGDFDISVYPIVKAWGFSDNYNPSYAPNSLLIDSLMMHIGSDMLSIENTFIYKKDKKIKIDLSAIAKGWGVDQIGKLLKSYDIIDFLIEIGGEILVSGMNDKGSKWEIGINTPSDENTDLFSIISISNSAIATSGIYHNYFELNGKKYSHIINPHNGYPIEHDLVSATIIADECSFADAIATSVMVKGYKDGIQWINSLKNVEGLLISKNENGSFISVKSNGFNY